jgi:hypothetical protein
LLQRSITVARAMAKRRKSRPANGLLHGLDDGRTADDSRLSAQQHRRFRGIPQDRFKSFRQIESKIPTG